MNELKRMRDLAGINEEKIACGDCFRYAWRWGLDVMNTPKEKKTKIVHGTVHPDFHPKRYSRAWVEYNGKVFDWQTQKTKPNGIPIKDFNKIYKPKRVSIYEPEESSKSMAIHGNYGLWE